MAQTSVNLPFRSDFESGTEGWRFANEEGKNVWVRGENADGCSGDYALYISNDGGETNNYGDMVSISHAYFEVEVPATGAILSFRYRVRGDWYEGDPYEDEEDEYYDALYVGILVDEPEAGNFQSNRYKNIYVGQNSWKEETIKIAPTEAGTRYVVFSWVNDGSASYAPAAAIDDVVVRTELPLPTGLKIEDVHATSLTLTWDTPVDMPEPLTWRVQRQEGFSGEWQQVAEVTEARAEITGLKENTRYYFRIMAWASEDLYSGWTSGSVGTVTPYACPAPLNVGVSKTSGGYEVSWETEAEQSVLYYRKADEETVNRIPVSGTSHTLADLEPAVAYHVQLRAVCSEQDTSLFSKDFSFMTDCGVQTLPFAEYFEAENWMSSSLLSCWTIVDANGDGTTWAQDTYGNGVDGSGCAKYGYSMSKAAEDWLISPQLQITDRAVLSFSIRRQSSSYPEKYSVWISETDKEIASFAELRAEEEIEHSEEFSEVEIDLAAYSGKKVYIAIKASSIANQYGLYVDNFIVSSCPAPSGVKLADRQDALTATSAWISFEAEVASCIVEYREAGAATWLVVDAEGENSVELADLTENTSYEVRVKAICSENEESMYSGILKFHTPCFAYSFPFREDFASVSDIPECWDNTDHTGTGWKYGSNYIGSFLCYNGSNQQYANLLTPIIDISESDPERLELVFSYSYNNYSEAGKFNVSVSTNGGGDWTSIGTFSSTVLDTVSVPLKDFAAGASSLRFRFEGLGTRNWNGNGVSIFQVKIQHMPICFPPVELTVEDMLFDRINLTWSAPDAGSPEYYQVSYYVQENREETLIVDSVEGTETLMPLTGLTQNTSYRAEVISVCATENSESVAISWQTPYSCLQVEDLRISRVTPGGAVVSWKSDGDRFTLSYKKTDDSEWTTVENIEVSEYTLMNLERYTEYEVQVQVVCSEEDQSLWNRILFRTPCEAVRLPYAEDFEEDFIDNAPACWSYVKVSGNTETLQWKAETNPKHAKVGERALSYDAFNIKSGHSAIMATPLLDFSAEAVYTIDFWMYRDPTSKKEHEGIKVFVSESLDTIGAELVAYIHGSPKKDPVPSVESEDGWYAYNFDITGVSGMKYILLYGISEWGYSIFIDDFRVNVLYETNIALQEIKPVYPRADLERETVSVVLTNTGLSDFVGELDLAFRTDEQMPQVEKIVFTEEDPLMPETEFVYTFAAKADFSAEGKHDLTVWAAAAGDPVAWDDTLRIETIRYAPVALPYHTVFDGRIEEEQYIRIVDAGSDSYSWIVPKEDAGAFLPPHPQKASDDYLYTPGLAMPAGTYEIEVVYGAEVAATEEKLSVRLASDFEDTATIAVLELPAITQARDSAKNTLRLPESAVRMLRLHGKSDAGQGGLNLFALRVNPLLIEENRLVSICQGDTYSFGGETLTSAGSYTDTLAAAGAPDTVVILTLTVNPTYRFQLDTGIYAGASVEFGGKIYTEAGDYLHEYLTEKGCDSIYSLHLTVYPPVEDRRTASICQGDSYSFGGETLTTSGIYTDTLSAAGMPDTVVILTLTVNPTYRFQLDTTICAGASVEFGGEIYTETGDYVKEYQTEKGCDSIYSLNLKVNPKPVDPKIDRKDEDGRVELWADTEEPELQWYNAAGAIEGAKEARYTVTENGIYYATALNDCGESEASNTISVENVGNGDRNAAEAPVLYPNPARDIVRIVASSPIEKAVVYLPSGKKAVEKLGNGNSRMQIPVSSLPSGIYAVKVWTETGMYTYKIVVIR